MVIRVLDIPLEELDDTQLPVDAPQWLRPYLLAAQRSGLTANWQDTGAMSDPVTGAEAAVMLQNALDLTVSSQILESAQTDAQQEAPSWAYASLTVMAENGVMLDAGKALTRADVAQTLYLISKIAPEAPGMAVFRMQQ